MANIQKAVLLARVSSKSQEAEGYSLNAQESFLREYAASKNLHIVRMFKIAETASKQIERTTFHELLTYLNDGKANHLIVEKTDRLTRNLKDAVHIDDWLESNEDRRLHLVKEHSEIHKNAKSDVKFMWTIHLAVAKKYTDNLREEVAKGVKQKLAEGWFPASPPVGYKTVGDTGKKIHVIDKDVAPLVKYMFQRYLEPSCSLEKLTREMAAKGFGSKYGNPMSRSHIQKTLKNPFYIGVNRWCGVEYPGNQEPLISEEVFEAVRVKMHRKNAPRYNKHNPDYKGVFKCTECGGLITWEKQKGHWYGHCNSHRKFNGCPKKPWIRQDRIEEKLLPMFDSLLCPSPAILEWVKTALRARHMSSMNLHAQSTENLRKQLDIIVRKKDILYEDRLAERIDSAEYDKRHNQLHEAEKKARLDLTLVNDTKNRQFEHGMKLLDLSQDASKVFPTRSPEQKRIILSKLFSNLSINGNTLEVEFSELASAIADTAIKHKELLEKFEPSKNGARNGSYPDLDESLRTIWLGLESVIRTSQPSLVESIL